MYSERQIHSEGKEASKHKQASRTQLLSASTVVAEISLLLDILFLCLHLNLSPAAYNQFSSSVALFLQLSLFVSMPIV